MKKELNKELKTFGYGLALFIPFIVMMHSVDHQLSVWSFVIVVIGLLFILSKSTKWPIAYFVLLAGIMYMLIKGPYKQEPGLIAKAFLGASAFILAVTVFQPNRLQWLYDKWMVCAHFIGTMITAIILTIFYYLIFGTVGIILKIFGKDLLKEKIDKSSRSYWNSREEEFRKEFYERQF